MKGLVIKSTGSWYHVQLEDGTILDCRIKGKFRTKDIKTTNPIAVGDRVRVEIDEESEARTADNTTITADTTEVRASLGLLRI